MVAFRPGWRPRLTSRGGWGGDGTLEQTARGSRVVSVTAYQRPFAHPSGAQPPAIPRDVLPTHVAIVMDGNGRWANHRGLPRTKGHEAGEAALLDVVAGAIEVGVTHLSAYAFSVSYTHLTLPTSDLV